MSFRPTQPSPSSSNNSPIPTTSSSTSPSISSSLKSTFFKTLTGGNNQTPTTSQSFKISGPKTTTNNATSASGSAESILTSKPSNNLKTITSGSQMSVQEMVEKINILQTQLFIVTKEKQQLEYKNQLLEQENQQLQKLVKSNPKNTQLSHHDSKIDSLVKKYEKIQEHNISQLGKTKVS